MSRRGFVCRASIALALGLFNRLPASAAEGEVGLEPGTRLRVTLAGEPAGEGSRLVGHLVSMDPDVLSLRVGDLESRHLRRQAIVRLEESTRPSRRGQGALVGFGVGFAAMFAVYTIAMEGDCVQGRECTWAVLIKQSAIRALPAAAVGALVAPGERWAEVPLGRAQRAARPSSGTGLQARLVPVVGDRRIGLKVVGSF